MWTVEPDYLGDFFQPQLFYDSDFCYTFLLINNYSLLIIFYLSCWYYPGSRRVDIPSWEDIAFQCFILTFSWKIIMPIAQLMGEIKTNSWFRSRRWLGNNALTAHKQASATGSELTDITKHRVLFRQPCKGCKLIFNHLFILRIQLKMVLKLQVVQRWMDMHLKQKIRFHCF